MRPDDTPDSDFAVDDTPVTDEVEKRPAEKVAVAADGLCEATVVAILAAYPGLVEPSSHWSLTLISILNEIGYEPARALCAKRGLLPKRGEAPDALKIVQNHLSEPMLLDIANAVENYVAESDSDVLRMKGVPGEVRIEKNGRSYSDPLKAAVPEKAASDDSLDWGSW